MSPFTFSPTVPVPATAAISTRPLKATIPPPSAFRSPPASSKLLLSGTLKPKYVVSLPAGSRPASAFELFSIAAALA
ncbi:hypothetical protein [Chroococcidiopsis sp. SAG 2025]|uniref:hypothetical protein n=1 Tax=Chroococcidiopsis sp. SAG 2025 TaxID=171389 RepID=UPI0029371B65|nr:hypothetical protein [Chroococcidiopsis sp. SAG 2025]